MNDAPFVVVATGLAFEAAIARCGADGRVRVCCGHGERLTDALGAAAGEGCRGVLSFGIAAGLDPALAPGTAVIASEVVRIGGETAPVDRGWQAVLLARSGSAVAGRLLGVGHPVSTVEAKHRLHLETGAIALDMESHIAGAFAADHGLPFAALRVVADPAGGVVPDAAVATLRPDGTVDVTALLCALVRRPAAIGPLVRVAGETARARRTLVGMRRSLGAGFGLPDIG